MREKAWTCTSRNTNSQQSAYKSTWLWAPKIQGGLWWVSCKVVNLEAISRVLVHHRRTMRSRRCTWTGGSRLNPTSEVGHLVDTLASERTRIFAPLHCEDTVQTYIFNALSKWVACSINMLEFFYLPKQFRLNCTHSHAHAYAPSLQVLHVLL